MTDNERIQQYEDMANHWMDVATKLNEQLKQHEKTISELQLTTNNAYAAALASKRLTDQYAEHNAELQRKLEQRDKTIAELHREWFDSEEERLRLLDQNAPMLEALEWYGGEQYGSVQFSPPIPDIPILRDGGQRAHKAISQVKGSSTNGSTIREPVRWFAEQMEATLKKNDHKGGWERCGRHWLRERIREELEELHAAMSFGTPDKVISEATDIANFAMMIADKERKKVEA